MELEKNSVGGSFRWGVMVGALLGNNGFRKEFFAVLESTDGPTEKIVSLLGAIERNEVDSVRNLVESMTGGTGETALNSFLQRIRRDVVLSAMEKSQKNLQLQRELDPAKWVEWTEAQVEAVRKKL
tara:strand:+ start:101 stop:478 length:378 start_codon:yes stop_codon:yes gene_type:complete